ncbi:MAG: hypothetical protein U9Q76_07155 [candidate division WOR-3 bacterium]|nr:hypothetical protein [candidate division WOR-3 bacterium]
MKRIAIFKSSICNLLILNLLIPVSLSAAPVLVEAYQEGTITIPADKIDTVTVVELAFSVDTSCYVQFIAGGLVAPAKMFLELNDNRLFPIAMERGYGDRAIQIGYVYPLTPGQYAVHLRMTNILGGISATCHNAYLQALIFLPDVGSAVAEPPGEPEPRGLSPLPALISRGPYVNVSGATELVDASGRGIEGAIEANKVFIANLPPGTYFARDGERTIVKIVKVE